MNMIIWSVLFSVLALSRNFEHRLRVINRNEMVGFHILERELVGFRRTTHLHEKSYVVWRVGGGSPVYLREIAKKIPMTSVGRLPGLISG